MSIAINMASYYLHVDYQQKWHKPWFSAAHQYLEVEAVALVCSDGREYFSYNQRYLAEEIRAFVEVEALDLDNWPVSFYSFNSPYQWLALCSLYGSRANLPEVLKMGCSNLQQTLLEINASFTNDFSVKEDSDYPFPNDITSAIGYARWYKQLHEFLNKWKQVR